MRKIFLFTVLIGGLAVQGFSQNGLRLSAYMLPQAVLLYNADDADLSEEVFKHEIQGGMAGGVSVGYVLGNIGAKLGLIYSQQGGKYSFQGSDDAEVNVVTRLEYVKIPLTVGYQSRIQRKVGIFAHAGAQLGILTQAKTYNDNTDFQAPLSPNITSYPTLFEAYEDIDISLVGEVGVQVRLAYNLMADFHVRADFSLQDVENKEATFLLTDAGETQEINFWENQRGRNRGDTRNITAGLSIGITYLMGMNP